MVRRKGRALRAHLEVYSREPGARERLAALLAGKGFERLPEPTNFGTTLLADLTGRDDAAHFASLSQGVRQNIRAIAKFPIEMRRITEVELSPRMNALLEETLSRTGATHQSRDFGPIIQLSLAHPRLSNLTGLYRTDISGPESLVAYAWGVNQGDSVAYDIGASTRVPEFRNLSLGYPLVWELMVWGRSVGAPFFDFGGITAGGGESEDRLGRISDFKRRFSKEVVQVAEEWVYAPHPLRNLVAGSISRAAALVHR
jgi:lipid II:glycine glycyltransferase (peptidoglycan interpeptide bridge formation enzyme)